MNLIYDIQQNTPEWTEFKLGKFSASSAADLLMDKKTKGYQNLIARIVEERITGKPCESKWEGNQFTERGHEFETEARNDYELRNLTKVDIIGLIEMDNWTVCSPDGLIGETGLIQIKSPIFNTQKEYLKTRQIPGNYHKQMQFELFVSGRDFNVFYSYHPSLPPVEIILNRDEKIISEIQQRLEEAKTEVIEEINFLKSL
jgi:hypothetical protein